jgi:3,4-dihydroxy 2-butanone 4-phosphate synthase/GTP cyclohydrolase II
MRLVAEEGRGVIVHMRGHEGRGIGLLEKLRAYQLQDEGWDTVDANLQLGHSADGRDYTTGVQILEQLGVRSVRLLTNNPTKPIALTDHGIRVIDRVPLVMETNAHNEFYMRTKAARMHHDLRLA